MDPQGVRGADSWFHRANPGTDRGSVGSGGQWRDPDGTQPATVAAHGGTSEGGIVGTEESAGWCAGDTVAGGALTTTMTSRDSHQPIAVRRGPGPTVGPTGPCCVAQRPLIGWFTAGCHGCRPAGSVGPGPEVRASRGTVSATPHRARGASARRTGMFRSLMIDIAVDPCGHGREHAAALLPGSCCHQSSEKRTGPGQRTGSTAFEHRSCRQAPTSSGASLRRMPEDGGRSAAACGSPIAANQIEHHSND
jgi:hypothetical protein